MTTYIVTSNTILLGVNLLEIKKLFGNFLNYMGVTLMF